MRMQMTENEKKFFLDGDQGLRPYLRSDGMPQDKVRQIAWLLLNGGGCAFCKVCRDEPCNIKDGESCTDNIANYIRKIVAEEELDPDEQDEQTEQTEQPWQAGQIEKTLVGYVAGQHGDSEHSIYTCEMEEEATLHRFTNGHGVACSAIYNAQNKEMFRCRRRFEHDMIEHWNQSPKSRTLSRDEAVRYIPILRQYLKRDNRMEMTKKFDRPGVLEALLEEYHLRQ